MYIYIYIHIHDREREIDPAKLIGQDMQQVDGKAKSKVQIFELLVK